MLATNGSTPSNWKAELRLQFGHDHGHDGHGEHDRRDQRTMLRSRHAYGPLVVQKPLYPEGSSVCHIYLIHPPGGVVGGDELRVEMALDAHANVLLTTPGAARFYRSAGATATQKQSLQVGADAALEWLPQETILFSGSKVEMATTVQLDARARFIGWDMTCLGRPASGDVYAAGSCDQRYQILRDGQPLLLERNRYRSVPESEKGSEKCSEQGSEKGSEKGSERGSEKSSEKSSEKGVGEKLGGVGEKFGKGGGEQFGGRIGAKIGEKFGEKFGEKTGGGSEKAPNPLRAEWGLAGNTVIATLYALPASADMLTQLRDNLPPHDDIRFACTLLNDVLVFRCIGSNAESCRELLIRVWTLLRPFIMQRAACPPRIWNT